MYCKFWPWCFCVFLAVLFGGDLLVNRILVASDNVVVMVLVVMAVALQNPCQPVI